MVFENRAEGKICGLRRKALKGVWRKFIKSCFITCTTQQVLLKALPLYTPLPLGGRGCIAPNHCRPRHYMGWVVSVTSWPRFSPRERTLSPPPGANCTGGWVGPRTDLDTEARGKILPPLPGIEPRSPGRPALSQTLYWLSYPGSSPGIIRVIKSRSRRLARCVARMSGGEESVTYCNQETF
jgi:hypothetical protein